MTTRWYVKDVTNPTAGNNLKLWNFRAALFSRQLTFNYPLGFWGYLPSTKDSQPFTDPRSRSPWFLPATLESVEYWSLLCQRMLVL